MAVQLTKCDGTMANMTLLKPGVIMAVQLTEFARTMVNMSLLMPGVNLAEPWA